MDRPLYSDVCIYCASSLVRFSERYVVKHAILAKGMKNRWITVGYSCLSCVDKHGKPTCVEYDPSTDGPLLDEGELN